MKRLSLAAIACFASMGALAADLPNTKEEPVFAPPPPAFSWTGFYIGLNAGGAWGTSNVTYVPPGLPFTAAVAAYSAIGSGTLHPDGFTGGGQAGYNWQTGPLVLGVEGDFDALDLRRSFTQTGTPPANVPMTATASVRTDWLATARARLGFTPFDRLLVYVTGGGALTHFDYNEANAYPGFVSVAFSSGTTRLGWTAGGGLEYGILPHWSIKAEYLYADVGSVSGTLSLFGLHSYSANLRVNEARAGIDYHF